jgi:hypothetical protein
MEVGTWTLGLEDLDRKVGALHVPRIDHASGAGQAE